MSIRTRIILSFLTLGLVIILASALAVVPIKSKLEKIGHFHTAALYSIQSIHSGLTEAVEESFAYVVSGETVEKDEFLRWAGNFPQNAQTFFDLARLDQPEEQRERALYDKIVSNHPVLVKRAQVMFAEYETIGSITPGTFEKYEETIDVLTHALGEFVKIEKAEVEHSQQIALDTINISEKIIYGVGALSLLAAMGSGLLVARRISNPIRALIQGTKDLGAGNLDVQMKVTSEDEIGALAQSFNEMAVQLQKTREQLLHKEYIENIINQLPIPIAILKVNEVNGEYQYIYEFANESISKLNNRTTEEHIGHSLEEIITNEEAVQDIKANFHQVIKSKKITARQINIPIAGKIGQLLEFHFPIEYNKSVVSVGAALMDITELVQAREEADKRSQELQESHEKLETRVQERTEELQKVNRLLIHSEKLAAMGKLSASFAHEFNNPLTVVIRGLDHISDTLPLDEKNKKLFHTVNKECVRMAGMVQKLLDFHRPSSGEIEHVDIHTLIDEILLLQERTLNKKSIKIDKHFAPQLPKIHVVPDQIKQVLLNLVKNAEEAITGEEGTITISTEKTGDQIKIRIQDTGVGIPPQDLESVFDPFFSTKKSHQGTGLGLSVSFGIAKAHGGDLSVKSELGAGTTFTLALPGKG